MNVDFNGLRKSLVNNFNELIDLINENSSLDDDCGVNIELNSELLSDKLRSLRTDILFVAALESEYFDCINFELKSFKV